MSDQNTEDPNDDDDDVLEIIPLPHERTITWDYALILVAGILGGVATQWVMTSVAAQFGIDNIAEWVAALTPNDAAQYGDALRVFAVIGSIGQFFIPTLIFVHFFYGRFGYDYLNADTLPRFANFGSALGWIICALPMIQGAYALNAYAAKTWGWASNPVATNRNETIAV